MATKARHGEALRKVHDAHVRALQARKGRAVDQGDDEMVSTAEAARRLLISIQTFHDRMRDPALAAKILKEERRGGEGGQGGVKWFWRWGDIKAHKARFSIGRRNLGGPGRIAPEERSPMSSMYTGRFDEQAPVAKRVARVDLPGRGTYSVYDVQEGERLPNRTFAPAPGLWATDGVRTFQLPFGLDEVAKILQEGDPVDGVRVFAPMTEAAVVPVVLPKRRRKVAAAAQALLVAAALTLPGWAWAGQPETGGHAAPDAAVTRTATSPGRGRGLAGELWGCSAGPQRSGNGAGGRLLLVMTALLGALRRREM